MSNGRKQVDQNSADKKETAKWEKWLFWPLALGISSFFIYLKISGIDTSQALINFLGFITMAALFIGVIAFVIAVLAKVFRLLAGR